MKRNIINYFLLAGLAFLLSLGKARGQQSYEAESAILSNGAHAATLSFCSGGKDVSGIGDSQNGCVSFDHISVPVPGLYRLSVYYITGDDRSFTLTVNNGVPLEAIFHTTAGGNAVSTQRLLVPLQKGQNRICFNNADEGAPGLDRIVISAQPVQSASLTGKMVDDAGQPMAGVTLSLGGNAHRQTVTDTSGNYRFTALPKGEYEITPRLKARRFSPYSRLLKLTADNERVPDFEVQMMVHPPKKQLVLQFGKWKILYDKACGTATFYKGPHQLLTNVYALVKMPKAITSMDYPTHRLQQHFVHDKFGHGKVYRIISSGNGLPKMIQTFWLYDNLNYLMTSVQLKSKDLLHSNYMAPLVTTSGAAILGKGDNRALFVPFDNDKWVRYDAYPFGKRVNSYEVSAWYNNQTRLGMIIGSVEHDTWKTGVQSVTSQNALRQLTVFGGVTGTKTRDVLPHGKIAGKTIRSPKIFVGYFSDWRNGMDAYAQANAIEKPAQPWTKGIPFGWNSWGKIQFKINYDKAIQVSDFFAQHLQPNHFENDSIVYIGLDAGWDHLSDKQLKAFVDHCHQNHQQAGIYFGPFAAWGNNRDKMVEGSRYKYKDIYLYAHHQLQRIDGGIAVDPTHPGTKERMKYYIDRFKKAGFRYVKIDFLVHGALEADHYYDPRVTTGMQAFNEGMRYLRQLAGNELYIDEAISPLMPGCYANSRRIGCDSWGAISHTEYTLNALTYGWWLDKIYDFNDADHVVLDGYSEAENRSRITSSAITGIFILGDDFSKAGSALGKKRVMKLVTNAAIDQMARIKDSFRPVDGNTGNHACELFQYDNDNYWYIVAFNYSDKTVSHALQLARLHIPHNRTLTGKELWSGKPLTVKTKLQFNLQPRDVKVFRLKKD